MPLGTLQAGAVNADSQADILELNRVPGGQFKDNKSPDMQTKYERQSFGFATNTGTPGTSLCGQGLGMHLTLTSKLH